MLRGGVCFASVQPITNDGVTVLGLLKTFTPWRWSLRLKLTAAVLLVMLFGIWGVVMHALSTMQGILQKQQMEQALVQVRHYAEDLDTKLADYLARLASIATNIDKSRLDNPAYLQAYLAQHEPAQTQFDSIGLNIMDSTGRSVADYPVVPGRRGTLFTERQYFQLPMATAQPYIDEPVFGWMSKRPILVLGVPIVARNGQTWGVLSGVIDLTRPGFLGLPFDGKLLGDTEQYVVSMDSSLFVANSKGLEKLSPLPPPGKSDFADLLRGGFTGVTVSSSSEAVEKLYTVVRLRDKNWVIVQALPTAVLFKPIRDLRFAVLGGATLITLAAMLFVFWLARRTMAPLEAATRQIDAMSSGQQILEKIASAGDPEVRSLISSFNRLTARIEKDRQRSETILRTASDGIHVLDSDGLLVEANDAFLLMLGHDRSAIGSLHVADWDAQDSWTVIKARNDDLINSGDRKVFESRHRRSDGRIIDVEIHARGFEVDGQRYLMAASRDISDRKQAEATLRTREEQLRMFIDHAPAALAMFDREMCYLAASQRWREEYGLGDQPLIGRSHYEIFPEIGENWKAVHRRGLAGEVVRADEDRFVRADGSVQWLMWEVRPWQDCDGRIGGIMIFTVDISERKNLIEQMAAYQKDLEGLVELRTRDLQGTNKRLEETLFAMDKSGIGIHWVDCDTGRFLYVNSQAASMLGYTVEEMLALRVPDIDPTFPPEDFGIVTQALRDQGHAIFESSNRTKDGRLFPVEVALFYRPETADTPGHFITFITDISQRKEAQAALLAAKQAAEAANVAKSTFLASMSHEIRTPLNAILGMTHLLMRIEKDREHIDKLQKIEKSGHHLLGVINDILDLSKIEAGKLQLVPKHFALDNLLDNVASMIGGSAAEKGLTVSIETDPSLSWLYGDETRIRQGLLNYAGNAIKFTEQGGVVLRAQRIESLTGCHCVRFEVRDSGVGIDAETQARLFRSFEQADASTTRKHGGTGLGLVITRRIAELMGGTAGVESTPGTGSTFWFTAWLEDGKPVAAERWTAEASVAALRERFTGARVLLVEDNAINREVAVDLLQETGLVVDTAENGRIAVDKVRTGQYDLVLMDMQMPEMDGVAATQSIRALPSRAALPIIAMTANAFDEDRRICTDAGMNDFVSKPVDPPALYGTLLKWLETRTLVHENHASESDSLMTPAGSPAKQHDAEPLRRLSAAGIDIAPGLAMLRGKVPLYLKLLQQLVDEHGRDAERITALKATGDRAGARAITHTLKGVAGNLRLTDLTEIAKKLDECLAKPAETVESSEVPALIDALGQQFQRLAQALE
jgi:PAS domain S-box-containing protein